MTLIIIKSSQPKTLVLSGRWRSWNTIFPLFPPFYSIIFFSLFSLLFSFFMFSYLLPFLHFLHLLIETNRFLQTHFNLNFPWFIFNLGHFIISPSTRFPRLPSVFLHLCKDCLQCKPQKWLLVEGPALLRGLQAFCQQGSSVGMADTVDELSFLQDF